MAYYDCDKFLNPEPGHRVNPITHNWPADRATYIRALKDYGFGGVVTNVPFDNGFTGNPDNLDKFKRIIGELDAAGMTYWIYDEHGYPSGYAHGETLNGHPELEAKGFYMVRRVNYLEPRVTRFTLDDESDKVVWAAKYPIERPEMHESFIHAGQASPVPFSENYVECRLDTYEALFIFCVKPAYEGSHCVHNVCSYSRYINVMDERAVRRFIDLCFEPIAAAIPGVYKKARAVFTDEPSLQVGYGRDYEVWPYALAPWVDGLFEKYENEYGHALQPYLPFIFEGRLEEACDVRVKFYRLIGKIIARAYSGQLTGWCEARGGRFSGHYLGEESMVSHAKDYGSYLKVLSAASYPGIDVLLCYPEVYDYNTAKFPQMAARKKNSNGMMAEICPFYNIDEFAKDPVENMTGVMGLLYLGGVRVTHSYFSADYTGYAPQFAELKGYMKQADAIKFNEYVGRLGYMLDGLTNDCGLFVYYGIEDTQAKLRPNNSAFTGRECEADVSTKMITRKIYESGYDFMYADCEDIVNAAKSANNGFAVISGRKVETLIIPALDVMDAEAMKGIGVLKDAGVKILFLDKIPSLGIGGFDSFTGRALNFKTCLQDEIIDYLNCNPTDFNVKSEAMIIKGRFDRDGVEMWLLLNNTRKGAEALLDHANCKNASLYDPADGSITRIDMGKPVKIRSLRGIFVVFD